MARRLLFTLLWAAAFFYGSAVLLGSVSGLLMAGAVATGRKVGEESTLVRLIGTSWAVVPMAMGPVGLVLGLLGRLPGTQRDREREGGG